MVPNIPATQNGGIRSWYGYNPLYIYTIPHPLEEQPYHANTRTVIGGGL